MRAGSLLLAVLAVLSCAAAMARSATANRVDPAGLSSVDAALAGTPGLTSALVLRRDRLVLERYYHGGQRDRYWSMFSVTKSVVSGEYARRKLFRPLRIRPGRWNGEGQGNSLGGGGLFLRPRDMLRLGRLYLDGGRWRGRQILPLSWVRDSTALHVRTPGGGAYGYLWWINRGPHGGYAAEGSGGQVIAIFPRLAAVVVLTGVDEDPAQPLRLVLQLLD